jgi:hypothetical protein
MSVEIYIALSLLIPLLKQWQECIESQKLSSSGVEVHEDEYIFVSIISSC